jgi:hypothetical protein
MGRKKLLACLVFICVLLSSPLVYAQYSSNSYSTNEVLFGTGGALSQSSANYQGQASLGATGGGDFFSANYRSNIGFLTQNEVFLAETVNTSTVDLGTLSTTATASGTASFSVRTYLSQAYSVITASPPLTNEEGHVFNALTTPTAVTTGVEQFGMNLVKNTNFCGSGCNLGADPVNQPDNTFANGQAASGYNTANLFKYVQGDVIANSPATAGSQAIGETDYTISYIADQAPLTEAGLYTMNHDIVVVPTY